MMLCRLLHTAASNECACTPGLSSAYTPPAKGFQPLFQSFRDQDVATKMPKNTICSVMRQLCSDMSSVMRQLCPDNLSRHASFVPILVPSFAPFVLSFTTCGEPLERRGWKLPATAVYRTHTLSSVILFRRLPRVCFVSFAPTSVPSSRVLFCSGIRQSTMFRCPDICNLSRSYQ